MLTLDQVSVVVRAGRVSQQIVDAVVDGDYSHLTTHPVLVKAVRESSQALVMEALEARSSVHQSMNNAIDILNAFHSEQMNEILDQGHNSYSKLLEEAKQKDLEAHLRNVQTALSVINGVRILKDMGLERGNPISMYILYKLLVKMRTWHKGGNKQQGTLSYGQRILASVKKVLKDHAIVQEFKDASKLILNNYTTEYGDATKEVVPEPTTNIELYLNPRGITLKLRQGVVTKVKNGAPIQFPHDISHEFTAKVFNSQLLDVLKNINIHEEIISENVDYYSTEPVKTYNPDPIMFGHSILTKLLLIKENKIDLTSMFEEKNKDSIMVLVRDGAKLEPLSVPGYSFNRYENFVSMSLTDAKRGIVSAMKSLPRMLEYVYEHKGIRLEKPAIYTREPINKLLARLDKLYNKKGWVTKPVKLLIINDTSSPELFKHFGAGDIKMPDWWLHKYGMCRVITQMDEGGIKAVTSSTRLVDEDLALKDYALVGYSAFKGKELSAAGLKFGYDFLQGKGLPGLVDCGNGTNPLIDTLKKAYDAACTDFVVGGHKVKGIVVHVPMIITNAYTVESVVENIVEEEQQEKTNNDLLLEKINKTIDQLSNGNIVNGLRDRVMNRTIYEEDFTVLSWITEGLENGTLKRKPSIARINPAEIQSVSYWHGRNVATKWLNALATNEINTKSEVKRYGTDWLKGIPAKHLVNSVKAETLIQVMVEGIKKAKHAIKFNSNYYPQAMLVKFVETLTRGKDSGWVEILYPDGGTVYIPTGYLLLNDFDCKSTAVNNLVKGLLSELMDNLKRMVDEDGKIASKSVLHSKFMNAVIQTRILGKEYGYQYTEGFYGILLPFPQLERTYEMGLTRRSRVSFSTQKKIRVNSRKHPTYFKDSSAGFECYDHRAFPMLTEELKEIFNPAVFMHPETIMVLQNDADGDGCSVSNDGYNLPLFKGPLTEFNAKFFKDFLEDEQNGSKFTQVKPVKTCNIRELQTAVYKAVTAKDYVGQFTATKYIYEASLLNVFSFTGADGNDYNLTQDDRNKISAILNQLVQMEAMDNIKQEGSDDFISVLISHHNITHPRKNSRLTDQECLMTSLKSIEILLLDLLRRYNVADAEPLATKTVMALHYMAATFKREDMVAMNIVTNSRVQNDNFKDISKMEEATGHYNFLGSVYKLKASKDQNSMYKELIDLTVTIHS